MSKSKQLMSVIMLSFVIGTNLAAHSAYATDDPGNNPSNGNIVNPAPRSSDDPGNNPSNGAPNSAPRSNGAGNPVLRSDDGGKPSNVTYSAPAKANSKIDYTAHFNGPNSRMRNCRFCVIP